LLLLAALSRDEFAEEIGDVDFLWQLNDSICPVVTGVLKTDVEVPHNKGGAVGRARLPCHSKIIHPHCTVGGDIDPHDVELLIASNKLEGQKVWECEPYGLNLEPIMVLPPDEACCSLVLADRL
jgi:hypothetical protein